MKAAVWYGGENIQVEDIVLPVPGKNEVKIAVKYCGVCGTDVHIIHGEFPLWKPPAIMGHEYSGEVVEIGDQVKSLSVGDRVVIDPSGDTCGICSLCREGKGNLCINRTILRGAFAEYTIVPEKVVYKIPDELSFEKAALTEPISCAIHALDLSNIDVGEKALVIGGGAIGLIFVKMLKIAGISSVILSEPIKERRLLAEEMGADLILDPNVDDIYSVVNKYTQGGPHLVFEAVGLPKTIELSIEVVKKGGKCIFVGVSKPGDMISIKPYDIFEKELKIYGSHMRLTNYDRAINIVNKLEIENLISNKYSLEQTLKAIKAVELKKEIKPLVKVGK